MRKMTVDVVTRGNSIGGRQGLAYVFNSGLVKTVKCDLDKPQEYEYVKEYDRMKVNDGGRYDLKVEGIVTHNIEDGKDEWYIAGWGCMLKSDFGFYDVMQMANAANLPVVKNNDVVAVLEYSQEVKQATCKLFKVGRIDIHCTNMATLIPLTEEEMQEVKKQVVAWVNRDF